MAAVAVVAALLGACGDPARDKKVGTIGYVRGFAGGVAADEPRAALVGRDVLSSGGTAADAAVAMAFTMAVTLPSSVGLGGGGVCVVHDSVSKTTETIEFLPPPSQPIGGAAVGVPALARGLYALHARYGRMRWEGLISPAEKLARFGEPVSRSLAREIAASQPVLSGDAGVRAIFAPQGRPLAEGDVLAQLDLAAVLGQLRQKGPGDLYGGILGRQVVEAARRSGAALSLDELRSYTPRFLPTTRLPAGNEVFHVPTGGLPGSELAAAWTAGGGSPSAGADAVAGAASLLAVDQSGSAVSCGLTMNAPFGSGRLASGTGVLLAAPEQAVAAEPFGIGLLINHNVNEFRYAVASAGGAAAANAARASLAAVRGGQPVDAAVASVAAQPAGAAPVNALGCPRGLPPYPGSCSVAVDQRHSGYGLLVGKP